MTICATCGFENAPGAKFCSECGSPLAAPVARREERKVVTVLFADLVGFTARAEQLDPEDVRALIAPYQARLKAELERFGGTLEKFIGDAVMAVFGAPVAHEDDPERAVRAALAIREAAADDGLEVRLGINTGEALVTVGADAGAGETLATGDVVNTAQRLQAAAPLNGVLVGEATYRATERQIDYREHAAVEAKGKAEPVPVWEAVTARARFGVDVDTEPATRLVGRRRELDQLVDALARAREERAPQLVTIVGVPGMGKSRLVQELFGAVAADPDFIRWRQGRSLPYGEGVSFWSLGEMVKAEAGILESDPPEAALAKLREAVTRVCSAAEAAWVESELRPLVGLPDVGAAGNRRDEAFAAWRRFLEGLADERPTVLVFEDLHWADDGVLDFVDTLVDWASDVPLLVVGSARPELLARRPGWGGGKTNAATLSLAPLSEQETAELVHALLERTVLPAEVQAAVLTRAGGNPLYAEEFARMVGERALGSAEGGLPVPESLQGLIAARLDALSAEEKQLLQNAAVVGKVFWPAVLADGSPKELEPLLHSLERKEFVRRERRSAVEGELQYAFRHVLVRDVAYGQIPRAARAEKHEHIATWMESLGREADVAELLAHHYLSALEYSRATGRDVTALGRRARAALREAGHRARALNSVEAALRFYEAAADLTPRDDPEWPAIAFDHARAGTYVDLANDRLLLEARDALPAGDPELAALAEALLGEYSWLRGERVAAMDHFRLAEELVATVAESQTKAQVLASLSRFAMLDADHERAVSIGRTALGMMETRAPDALRAAVLNNVGVSRLFLGDAGGLDDLETSMAIARTASVGEYVRSCGNLASSLAALGRLQRASELHLEALHAAREVGLSETLRWLTTEYSLDLYLAGRWREAQSVLGPLLAGFERSPFWLEPAALVVDARMRLGGAPEEARPGVERAVRLARESSGLLLFHVVLGFAARYHADLGELPQAGELLAEMLERLGETTTLLPEPWIIDVWFAEWRLGRDDVLREALRKAQPTAWVAAADALSRRDFAGAADRLAEIGALAPEADVRLWAAEWLAEEGRPAEADAEARRALALWRSVGATRYVRRGESLLAAAS